MRKLTLLAGVSALALMVGLSGVAEADTANTPVTHTAAHNDAATFWVGQANGASSCNAVSQTSASDTITITPPAGQYVYLTELLIQRSSDATGVTEVPTLAFTNISTNGGLAPFVSLASTLNTGGYHIDLAIPFPLGGLKSAQPGVAVTVVPSAAQATHGIVCMSAIGYFNSN